MGISELLKILKPIITEKHLSDFKNKTAAVDMMAWLYRGAYASAVDDGQGKKSDLYLNFPLKMIAMLKSYNIKCIAVFDGKSLQAKEAIEEVRNENKERNLEQARNLLTQGKEDESRKIFRRALKIKSRMVNSLVEVLKNLGVTVIFAPYEADSQISLLCKVGMADFAISEDSDLIPFGVGKIVYKLDANGNCSYLDMEEFLNSSLSELDNLFYDPKVRSIRKIFSSHLRLVEFCVMLGCDYLPSLKGFGFKTAISMFESYGKVDTILHHMKFVEKFKKNMPDGYSCQVKKCILLFFMQTVFNPIEGKLQPLNINFDRNNDNEEYIKSLFKEISEIEKNKFFGSMEFENYLSFCRGELDIKTMSKEKKLESHDTIEKYIKRFSFLKQVDVCKFNDEIERQNQIVEEVVNNYLIEIEEIEENKYEKEEKNWKDNNISAENNEENFNNYYDENYENTQDFQKYLYENTQYQDNFINPDTFTKINSNPGKKERQNNKDDTEITNILKICEGLSKEQGGKLINKEKIKKFAQSTKDSHYERYSVLNPKKIFTEEDDKTIKDLFDILEKEKKEDLVNQTALVNNHQENILNNINMDISFSTAHTSLNKISKDKDIINGSLIISPFKLQNSSAGKMAVKTPDSNSKMNPNMHLKRKFQDLQPKNLNFESGNTLDNKEGNQNDITNYITKRTNPGFYKNN